MSKLSSLGFFLGRLFISLIFILSGIFKFVDFQATSAYMAIKGMTMIPFFLTAAALIEILGGLSILIGFKPRLGATILFLYLIPTTIIFHSFWSYDQAQQQEQFAHFMKNIAIMGGLLYIVSAGAGKFCVGACCAESCSVMRDDEIRKK